MLIIYYFIPVVGQEKVGCYGKKRNCQLSAVSSNFLYD